MSKPEQKLYRRVVKRTMEFIPGLYFDRIENSVGVSIPDVTYSTTNGHGWLELKVAKKMKDDTYKLDTMTAQQENWLRTRDLKCGNVFVWVTIDVPFHFIFKGIHIGKVNGMTIKEMGQWAVWSNMSGINVPSRGASLQIVKVLR